MAHVPLGAVRNTIDAIKKRLKSLHRGTEGKAVNVRCLRAVTLPHSQTQTPNFTATQSRCGSRLQDGEDVPNGATLRRGAAVRDTCAELFDSVDCIIDTKGRKKNERGLPHGEREAVSEGNVAENMTIPRKAIGKSPRLRCSPTTMWDCTSTATLSALPITTTGKVSPKAALNTKKPSIHHEPTANHINLSYL